MSFDQGAERGLSWECLDSKNLLEQKIHEFFDQMMVRGDSTKLRDLLNSTKESYCKER
jgi:hypothetical protein